MSLYSFVKPDMKLDEFVAWRFPGYNSLSIYSQKIIDILISVFPQKQT